MTKLTDLPNIGPVAAENLVKVGIETPEELRRVGSREALLRIRLNVDSGACLSQLYGLEGAIRGVRWHALPPEVRAELKEFFKGLK